jgi:hypothetical protein
MSRTPGSTCEDRKSTLGFRSSPQRVEENAGRTTLTRSGSVQHGPDPAASREIPRSRASSFPSIPKRVPVHVSRPSRIQAWGPPRPGISENDLSHAGFPQGFKLTRRISSRLVLADECNRPNCQRETAGPVWRGTRSCCSRGGPCGCSLENSESTDTIGRCKAASLQLTPAAVRDRFIDEATTIIP